MGVRRTKAGGGWHAAVALAAALAAVAGCVTAPVPEDAQTKWIPPAGAGGLGTAGWAAVRADAPDLSRPLTLAELAELALQRHPASRKAWNEARAAAAQVDQAEGRFMPNVAGTLSAARRRVDADPDLSDQNNLSVGPGVQLSYLVLSFGGGRRAAVEQALQTVYAANHRFNRTLQDILLGAANAYYGLVAAGAGVEATAASVKDAAAALSAARERQGAGLGTELEVLQAQAAYDQTRYNAAGADGALKLARGTLAQALSLPADVTVNVVAPADAVPPGLPVEKLRAFMDRALARRSDLAALRATVAAQEAAARAAAAGAWPFLYLNGNLSHTEYDQYIAGDTARPGAQDRDTTFGAGVSIQWSLFDGWQIASARRAAEAQAAASRELLRQAELAASAEVWGRHAAYETARERHTASLAVVRSAEAAHGLALEAYRAGLRSMLDVVTAEAQLAQARRQVIVARQDVFTSLVALAHAAGSLDEGAAEVGGSRAGAGGMRPRGAVGK